MIVGGVFMLVLEKICVEQGDFRLTADFTIPAGARVAIVGPSGAGKSTLLGVIAGFLQPEDGRVLWDDQDLTPLLPGQRPVSVIFQDQNLFPHLNVAQNVGLGLKPSLRLTTAENEQVERVLGLVGLEGLGARRPAELSGGQQSRVALARMALCKRPIALLDEPFSALGPALKAEMLDLVAELAGSTGTTLMMITHDPEDARRIASHVILVDQGQVSTPEKTQDLFENPPEALRSYLGL